MPKKRSAENDIGMPAASAAAPLRRKASPRARTTRTTESVQTPVANVTKEVTGFVETATTHTSAAPTYQEIAQLAYSFWEDRGYQGGSPEEDWSRAEAQLRSRANA